MDDLSEFEGVQEAEVLRKANNALQSRLRLAKAKTEDLVRAVHDGARDASVILGKPGPIARPKADRRAGAEECAVLLCSDWHFGKRTESFGIKVAVERIRLLGEKMEQIAAIERADHPVRELHILLGGDMAENLGIFPGQAYEVDALLFEQVFAATGALEGLIRRMLAVFPSVHLWSQTGNHGRLGRKGDMPRGDNIDRMVYRIVEDRMAGEQRAVWHPIDGWYTIVEIGAYRALLVHGDQIKSFGGNVPAFGIARKSSAWASGVLPPFRDIWMGHFHQPLVIPLANGQGRVFVGPSIESDSAYAQEFMAATGAPGQLLKFVNPAKGRVTTERILWLDD
jgi:hypothetical protein